MDLVGNQEMDRDTTTRLVSELVDARTLLVMNGDAAQGLGRRQRQQLWAAADNIEAALDQIEDFGAAMFNDWYDRVNAEIVDEEPEDTAAPQSIVSANTASPGVDPFLREQALRLAIAFKGGDPLKVAARYYAFLKGDETNG